MMAEWTKSVNHEENAVEEERNGKSRPRKPFLLLQVARRATR